MDSIDEKIEFKTKSNSLEPKLKERQFIHRIELENEKFDTQWSLCCSDRKTDSRFLRWIAKIAFSSIAFSMSFYGLLSSENDDLRPFYCSIISMVIGLNINPEANNQNKNEK